MRSKKTLSGLFFDKLMRYALEPVVVTDSRGRIAFANEECLEYFGLSRDKVIGKGLIETVVPKASAARAGDIFSRAKEQKTLSFFETPVRALRGREKFMRWAVIPFSKDKTAFLLLVGDEKNVKGDRRVKMRTVKNAGLKAAHDDMVDMLVEASWAAEPETAKHSARVMMIAAKLAKKLGMGEKRILKLKLAALLHDLGKLGIDEKILFKKGKLEKHEIEEIRKHPYRGAEAVECLYFLRDIVPIMADHHENYDGTGYPRGVKAKDIPLEARVLSVADAYEALTADRPYRKGYSKQEAIGIMEQEKGHKLDPKITDVFFGMIKGKVDKWDNI